MARGPEPAADMQAGASAAPAAEEPARAEPPLDPPAAEPPAVDPFLAHQAQRVAAAEEHSGEAIEAANADASAFEQIETIWGEVVRDIRPHDKNLQVLLNTGVRPVDVKDGVVVLEIDTDWRMSRLQKPKERRLIEHVLSRKMGTNLTIQCVVEAQRRESPNVLREQIRTSRKDPLVKAALNIFDADIIGVEEEKESPE